MRKKEDYNFNSNGMVRSRWNPALKKEEVPYEYNKEYNAFVTLSGKLTYEQLKRKEYKNTVDYF